MKTAYTLLAFACLGLAIYLKAAESSPTLTVDAKSTGLTATSNNQTVTLASNNRASVNKDYEKNVDLWDKITVADLRASRDDLKGQVSALTTQVAQLRAAAQKLVEQRDAILAAEINSAVNAASAPQAAK